MMLISFTLEELKMLSIAVNIHNFEHIYEGSPIWGEIEKYEALEEKLNKEIEYYEIKK